MALGIFQIGRDWLAGTLASVSGKPAYIQAVLGVDSAGNETGVLPGTTDRSGTATTASGVFNVPANPNRKGLVGQNVGANNIGFNEQGGVAAIGTAGTYTVPPGSSFSVSTNKLVNFIAATGNTAVSMTEW